MPQSGVTEAEQNHCLLKQLCRGCWENSLIADLQLDGRKMLHPPFAELVVLIRIAEDKQSLKEERMRKHLGLNKHVSVLVKLWTTTHSLFTAAMYLTSNITQVQNHPSQKQKSAKPKSNADKSEVDAIKKEIAKLQDQISMMKTDPVRKEKTRHDENELYELNQQVADVRAHFVPRVQEKYSEKPPASRNVNVKHRPRMMEPEMHESSRPTWNSTNRPHPGYCFRCRKDGHLAVNWENDPNPCRVEENAVS